MEYECSYLNLLLLLGFTKSVEVSQFLSRVLYVKARTTKLQSVFFSTTVITKAIIAFLRNVAIFNNYSPKAK